MAAEREYKYLVAGAFPAVDLLGQRYGERGLELSSLGVREQRDVYFDTPDLVLLNAGVALRQRRFGTSVLATYKGAGVVRDGLHVRDEVEVPYTDPWPAEIAGRLGPLGVLDVLQPLVELSARRERYLVRKGSEIGSEPLAELSFDEVTGREPAGGRAVQFRELELELLPDTLLDTGEGGLEALTAPLALPGLTPHAGDKLSHTLQLLGRV